MDFCFTAVMLLLAVWPGLTNDLSVAQILHGSDMRKSRMVSRWKESVMIYLKLLFQNTVEESRIPQKIIDRTSDTLAEFCNRASRK
jgi:hypothetical protein